MRTIIALISWLAILLGGIAVSRSGSTVEAGAPEA